MAFVINPPPQAAVPVVGEAGLFPVRRIFCVARNYAAHAREMGHDPQREPPFFFTKPADAVFATGPDATWPYPCASQDVHHEFELVVALGAGGRDLDTARARDCVWGYAAGLDMTRRDLQAEAKQKGRPWDVAKAFDRAAPIGPITPKAKTGWLDSGSITLRIDGEVRQQGELSDMIWSIPDIIVALSGLFELKPGDLIFTGTPEGVGPVRPGQRLEGVIDGLEPLRLEVAG
ncbi:MAG: fumarylacetoacetate hydrolase family protein [Rhodocyclaceae bacterium]|nr:fumarylacetoacetate hydrolase family protein [Rhodocyclaceae bacterium]